MIPESKTLFLTDLEVAEYLHVSIGTVRRWRYVNQGPKFIKIGTSVRYPISDLEEWLKTRVIHPKPALSADPLQ